MLLTWFNSKFSSKTLATFFLSSPVIIICIVILTNNEVTYN